MSAAEPAAAPANAGTGVRVFEAEAERGGLEEMVPAAALAEACAEGLAGSAAAVQPVEAEGTVIGWKEMGGDAGVEVVPAEPADASDALSAATRKRSNEQMQKLFHKGGIILGEEIVDDANRGRRQRIESTSGIQ